MSFEISGYLTEKTGPRSASQKYLPSRTPEHFAVGTCLRRVPPVDTGPHCRVCLHFQKVMAAEALQNAKYKVS
jgi:hypothetical protein